MTLWGEISEPGSRAAWNDEEEIYCSFLWKKNLPEIVTIDTFLLLEGNQFGSYMCEPSYKVIFSNPQVNFKLFEDEEASRVICCLKDYDLLKSSEIVEFLQDYLLVSGKVIALTSKSLAEYKVETQNDSSCVLRSLSTTKYKPSPSFPQLEQPNIISGVSAGVVMLREQLDKDAVAYLCYIDHPDYMDSQELDVLIQSLNIGRFNAQPSHVTTSNLYI